MTGLSSGGESVVLTALLTGRYISLHTADPGNTGASEVSGFAYARQGAVAFTAAGANPTVWSNTAQIEFPVATGSWGTITHFGIWSAVSAGTFYGGYALTASKAITTDDVVRWLIGQLSFSQD